MSEPDINPCSHCGGEICQIADVGLKGSLTYLKVVCNKCGQEALYLTVPSIQIPSFAGLVKEIYKW